MEAGRRSDALITEVKHLHARQSSGQFGSPARTPHTPRSRLGSRDVSPQRSMGQQRPAPEGPRLPLGESALQIQRMCCMYPTCAPSLGDISHVLHSIYAGLKDRIPGGLLDTSRGGHQPSAAQRYAASVDHLADGKLQPQQLESRWAGDGASEEQHAQKQADSSSVSLELLDGAAAAPRLSPQDAAAQVITEGASHPFSCVIRFHVDLFMGPAPWTCGPAAIWALWSHAGR